MHKVYLAKPELQSRVAALFPKDAPAKGSERRLKDLQAECDRLCASLPPPTLGRHSERARQLLVLAREYRRVAMGMVHA